MGFLYSHMVGFLPGVRNAAQSTAGSKSLSQVTAPHTSGSGWRRDGVTVWWDFRGIEKELLLSPVSTPTPKPSLSSRTRSLVGASFLQHKALFRRGSNFNWLPVVYSTLRVALLFLELVFIRWLLETPHEYNARVLKREEVSSPGGWEGVLRSGEGKSGRSQLFQSFAGDYAASWRKKSLA